MKKRNMSGICEHFDKIRNADISDWMEFWNNFYLKNP